MFAAQHPERLSSPLSLDPFSFTLAAALTTHEISPKKSVIDEIYCNMEHYVHWEHICITKKIIKFSNNYQICKQLSNLQMIIHQNYKTSSEAEAALEEPALE